MPKWQCQTWKWWPVALERTTSDLHKLYVKKANLQFSVYLMDPRERHFSYSDLGDQSPIWSPGNSHEEAWLQNGPGAVRPHPVPSHLQAGVASLHPHLCPPGRLLQCTHPGSWRLDKSFVQGLWGPGTRPAAAPHSSQVREPFLCVCINPYWKRIIIHQYGVKFSNIFILGYKVWPNYLF